MGNWICAEPQARPLSGSVPTPKPQPEAGLPEQPKLDPKDFMVVKLKDSTIVREPGSINGQQFIIDTVDNCDIFLFDNSAQIIIDFATNSRIFIGPCESSVFVRDSKSCRIICACQQLRTRDCADIDMMLYCSTQPSIETSKSMRLSCFQSSYFSLANQFALAGLCVWDNKWSRVHDFNEVEGERNYTLVRSGTDPNTFLGRNPSQVSCTIRLDETQLPSPVPLTFGSGRNRVDLWFVLVMDDIEEIAFAIVAELSNSDRFKLIETRRAVLTRTQIDILFLHGGEILKSTRTRIEGQNMIALLFEGEHRPQLSARECVFLAPDKKSSQYMANCFFQQFKPTI